MKNYNMSRPALTLLFVTLFLMAYGAGFAAEPAAPSDLKIKIEGPGFLLTWAASPDDPGKITGYEISKAEMGGGPYSQVGRVKAGILKYYDTKAKPEHIYFYKVRTIKGKSFSEYSNTVTGELPAY